MRVTEGKGENAKMREATAEDVEEAMKVVPREAPKNSSIGVTFLSSKTGHKGKGVRRENICLQLSVATMRPSWLWRMH